MSGNERRLIYTVPFGLADRIRAFAEENDYRNEREAMSALIEGALEMYPRWGVKRGIARVVSAEVRGLLMKKARDKSIEMAKELEEEMSSAPLEDMTPLLPDGSSYE